MRGALIIAAIAACFPSLHASEVASSAGQWAQWRGPLGTGVAPAGDPPVRWSEESNVRWKTRIPGKGHSTPVVWGDLLYLTTAIPFGEVLAPAEAHPPGAHDNVAPRQQRKFVVIAVNRHDGSIVWQRTVRSERPHDGTHVTGSWASSSPVTDGKHLIASFGSAGIYGLDMKGKLLWQADLGDMETKHGHGEGSSPALAGNTVVINWDHQGESFLVALDKRTGKPRWRVDRSEETSWSTPLIVEHDGRHQVIVAATLRVRSYDLETGELIWECGGLSGNVVASPVAADGIVYVANSYDTRAMMAIRLDGARGEITGTDAVLWTRNRDTPYVPSPILFDDALCFLKHYQGFLTCVNAKTGVPLYGPLRVPGIRNVFASLVGAAGRIYIVDRNGRAAVVDHAIPPRILARNQLDDSFSASPVIVGADLFLRGEEHLYRITESASAAKP